MSRAGNVRGGRIAERWAKERLEERGWLVVDGSPSAPVDLVAVRRPFAGTANPLDDTAVLFVEVKSARRPSRARNARLSPEEEIFRADALGRGFTHDVLRVHRTGKVCVPLPGSPEWAKN